MLEQPETPPSPATGRSPSASEGHGWPKEAACGVGCAIAAPQPFARPELTLSRWRGATSPASGRGGSLRGVRDVKAKERLLASTEKFRGSNHK